MAVEKKKFTKKLKDKYKLVILKDETFEEKASFTLSRLNVFILLSVMVMLFTILFVVTVIFTPLKMYIPGYADVNIRRDLTEMSFSVDSLEGAINARDLYLANIRGVISGEIDTIALRDIGLATIEEEKATLDANLLEGEEKLRGLVEGQEKFDLALVSSGMRSGISGYSFFSPLKGIVTEEFNSASGHVGVDIVAPKNETIKSTLDGTVILADFTSETGYVIAIQHSSNLISLYKHNSALLKKVGNFVRAGEAVAIIGSSGELASGPHLHFELWQGGKPLNPEEFITF
ncbi:MAG: murein DD-endopeptidase MepM/ murein hydrolase activator NlpD [Sphingobacteriales bacterium]|jgi:murein DD-endopeptidase MepM/ murein hydrolase activator NlpD